MNYPAVMKTFLLSANDVVLQGPFYATDKRGAVRVMKYMGYFPAPQYHGSVHKSKQYFKREGSIYMITSCHAVIAS